jgi:hypothetical protein
VVQGDPIPGKESVEITTDAEGRFTVTGQTRDSLKEAGPRYKDVVGSVVILAKGWAVGGGDIKKNAPNDFKLQASYTLTGTTRDEQGASVAGVKVRVRFIYGHVGNDSHLFAPHTLAQFSGV